MTNEKMVLLIQQGKTEYIAPLWTKVNDLISMLAGKVLGNYPEQYQQLKEDMVNESYFAFLKAIKSFDPNLGKFTTYLGWQVRRSFTVVIQGYSYNNPLDNSISYDTPIDDESEITIADTLEDITAENDLLFLENKIIESLKADFMDELLSIVSDTKGKELVTYMLENDCGVTEASHILYGGDSPVPTYNYYKALGQMRRYAHKSSVQERLEFWGFDDLIKYNTGLGSFKQRQFTSSVELSVMKRERLENKLINK